MAQTHCHMASPQATTPFQFWGLAGAFYTKINQNQ